MIEKRSFGKLSDGREVTLFKITNKFGEYTEFLDYGATWHSMYVKDADGNLDDVLLGVDTAEGLEGRSMEGSIMGRCANRVAYGRYQVNGKTIQLECNRGGHFLHGASGTYAKKLFEGKINEGQDSVSFSFHDVGEGGFDCEADITVTYSFDDEHKVEISYEMSADGDTLLCPTNHAYFNLSGGDIKEHSLKIAAEYTAAKGETGMPEGEVAKVEGTPLDFRSMRQIGEAMASDTDGSFFTHQVNYDDTFVLDNPIDGPVAELMSEKSGRLMRTYTDMPAIILFTMKAKEPTKIKGSKILDGDCAVCIETQFVPNAVNCPQFKSPLFKKGEKLISKTVYSFDVLER